MGFAYQHAATTMTLAEGLAEYRRAHPGLIDPAGVDPDLGRFMRAHDRCHIVFGLDTSIRDEILADTWTLFGSDVSWREYSSYLRHPEVNNILAETGYWTITVETLRHAGDMLRARRPARRQTAKWPFWASAERLDEPIRALRSAPVGTRATAGSARAGACARAARMSTRGPESSH